MRTPFLRYYIACAAHRAALISWWLCLARRQFSEASNILAVLMTFVLYPSILAAYVSLKKLKEDNWRVTRCAAYAWAAWLHT